MGAEVIVLSPAQLEELVERAVRRVLAERPSAPPPPPAPAGYMDLATASKHFATSADTLRRWIREGKLPRHRKGRHWLVRPAEVAALLARQPGADLDVETAVADMLRRSRGR